MPNSLRHVAGRARRSLRRIGRRSAPAGQQAPTRANSAPNVKKPKRDITKAYPRDSAQNLYDAVDYLRTLELARQNESLLDTIRSRVRGGASLRVTFLVNDRAKWNASQLVDALRERGWEARIALALTDAKGLDREGRRRSYAAERAFFERIDPDLVPLFDVDSDRTTPVESLNTDIIFYQQPWGMKDAPRRMAGRALGAYIHYGFLIMANHGMHYNIGTFHSYLWRYYTQSEAHRLLHLSHDPSAYDRLVVVGYPKLDTFLDCDPTQRIDHPLWGADTSLKRVIYSPHHSLGKDNLRMSTFRWTGKPMLELARQHPEIRWVYKPHPTLKHSVVRNGVMTRDEYEAYADAWASLPNAAAYEGGEYFELFRSSDVLITDCGSFLAEYLPTGNPIIRLVEKGSIGLNEVGAQLERAFYACNSLDEVLQTFRQVVIEGKDPLAPLRAETASVVFPPARSSSAHLVADDIETSIS